MIGGTDETFVEDMDHIADMWRRRVDVDVESRGLPEDIRDDRRLLLVAEYMTYPPRRVLLFAKRVRTMVMLRIDEEYAQRILNDPESHPEYPEDIIAQGTANHFPLIAS